MTRATWIGSASAAALVATIGAGPAVAAPRAAVPVGGGHELAVDVAPDGTLRAAVCPTGTGCDVARGLDLGLPAELRNGARVDSAALRLDATRGATLTTVRAGERVWQALVASSGGAPKLIFAGYTGLVAGEPGLRQGPMLQTSDPDEAGFQSVVVGEQHESLSLCGRETILAPKVLNPRDLALYPAKVQRLSAAERAAAERLVASPVPDEAAAPEYQVLSAIGASSGIGAPQALSDGDLETTWSENRGGDGRGEFVVFNAPARLPITGFQVAIRPPQANPDAAVAPKEFWLATGERVFHVTVPENAWEHPGRRYQVSLSEPVQASCIALVTESGMSSNKADRVSFGELFALAEFDAGDVDALVGALAGGGKRSEAARSVLSALGPRAFAAVAAAFERLDEGGRREALHVMDRAECTQGMPVYIQALLGPHKAQVLHARARIHRCGEAAGDTLANALRTTPAAAHPLLASELSLVAPVQAVRSITPRFKAKSPSYRRLMRVALAQASRAEPARDAVREELAADQPASVKLELLRALGERLPSFQPEAGRAFREVAASDTSFRGRYLLLEPAAVLARGDAAAREYLARALTRDPNPHIRWGAARAGTPVALFRSELLASLDDEAVRVREATLMRLAQTRAGFAEAAIVRRLEDDRWPIVRAAAAHALSGIGRSARADAALLGALDDDSAHVRERVLLALGRRRTPGAGPPALERLADEEEHAEVRRAAALALGELCYRDAIDPLTSAARRLADPLLDRELRRVAFASLRALGELGPEDLRRRLEPLLDEQAPVAARVAAQRVLGTPPSCRGRA